MELEGVKFTLGEELGSGAFAKTYRLHRPGSARNSGQVLKTYLKSAFGRVSDLRELKYHIEAMQSLSSAPAAHLNIVRLHSVHQSPTHICFRMEDAGSENLFTRMRARERSDSQCRPMSLATVGSIQMQAISALAHLHSVAGLAHRNIKPENIVYSEAENDMIKLVDFDMVTVILHRRVSKRVVGSFLFMAPEVWLLARYLILPTDIWSMGMVFSELLCGLSAVSKTLELKSDTTQNKTASMRAISEFFMQPDAIHTFLEHKLRPELRDALGVSAMLLSGMLQVPVPVRWVAGQLQSAAPLISQGIPSH